MSELTKKRRARSGHRAYVTKKLAKVKELTDDFSPDNTIALAQLKLTLSEKIETISRLDEQILESIEEEEDIEREIEEASEVKGEIYGGIAAIDELLARPKEQLSNEGTETTSASKTSFSARVKLPKLEPRKFSGKIHEWTEFWDSFRSAIHENGSLNDVDKFTYLRGSLEETARSAIAGFALTDANYNAAVELLQRRFGNKTIVQRAHVNELLNVKPVFNAKDTKRLRRFFDAIESNYRGLQALGVEEQSYAAIVVPSILNKLPEIVRLTITRGQKYLEWTMKELVEALLEEVELRESHVLATGGGDDEEYKEKRRYPPSTTSALFTKREERVGCAYCLGDHSHEDCKKVTDRRERMTLLRKYNRCFKCIRKGHLVRDCKSKIKCSACGGLHHISVCEKSKEKEKENDNVISNNVVNTSPSNMHVGTATKVALQTAQGVVKGEKRKRVRVLFDSGSQKTFVTARLMNEAGLTVRRKEWLEINTFGGRATGGGLRSVVGVEIEPIRGSGGVCLEAYVVPKISEIRNDRLDLIKHEYAHLKDLWLSDVCKDKVSLEIDVLIGADNLWAFQSGKVLRGAVDEPVAVETSLGWVLSGPMKSSDADESVNVHLVTHENVSGLNFEREVQKMWDLETLGIKEGNDVHEALIDKIKFNGVRYAVKLPWKQGHEMVPTNYANSLARMKGQIKRLSKEPSVLKEYDKIIREQLDAGVVEVVSELEKKEDVHYLPHQAVVRRDAKTTKLRVVYDASSKEGKRGTSLNDCLHVGPSLNPMLYDILLRFRENRIVLVGDIEKAFLNIEVDKEDRDYLRFLWVKDILNGGTEVVVYRFCRVVFGLNASPFLLNATLRYHIEKFSDSDPEFVRKMLDSFYVDDLVSGGKMAEEVVDLYEKAKIRMTSGGFTLRKWLTNDADLRKRIQDSEGGKEIAAKITRLDDVETYAKSSLGGRKEGRYEKVLGLNWDCNKDIIRFDLTKLAERAEGLPLTKRNLLSILAGLFDPLGIISPIVVPMKVLFQELCVKSVGWDEELADQNAKRCVEWIRDVKEVKSIALDRCVYDSLNEEVLSCELHGFGDASVKAYCAVVYFVYRTPTGVHVRLLTAKTRIAPLKSLTIPRLELMSAVMLARLVNSVRNAMKAQVECVETRYWLDSKTALCWIQNQGEWKQFVRHRVNEVLKLSSKRDWGHCPGLENPADLGSRGVLPSRLKASSLWWSGPEWLCSLEKTWPNYEVIATSESKEEEKKSVVMIASVKETLAVSKIVSIEKYSSLERVLRVTAWVNRFVHNLKAKIGGVERQTNGLGRGELLEAERFWIKAVQVEMRKQDNFQQLESQLQLFEEDGVLKCKGRLAESDLEEDAKYPIILPKDNRLTELVIRKCHDRVHHSGLRATLAEVRSRYWVPKGRQKVKAVISKCTVCRKLEGKPYEAPKQADLPSFRVKEAVVFGKTGVDFAGPLYVKDGVEGNAKVYIALFSCCVSRALYLDLVRSLSAVEFLGCLRRFSARRGTPSLIISDNAKTFKATAKALKKLYGSETVQGFLEGNRIEWRFNLERAPWWGGFFERMVRCVKRCLKKVLGNARLTFDELLTTVVEIEGTLNSRPLTYEYDEVGCEVLTPSHLMFGRRLKSMPDGENGEESEDETNCGRRFRYLAKKKQHYWNRWRKEYLVGLREFHRGKVGNKRSGVEKGDVVVVYEDNVKRGNWKMAEVTELIVGRDGQVRGARVRMVRNGKVVYLSRPVQKLYPTEIKREERTKENVKETSDQDKTRVTKVRPKRAAALDSEWKTKSMINFVID